jgi:hypothetical protein
MTVSCAANTRRLLQRYFLLTHTTFIIQTLSLPSNLPESYKHVMHVLKDRHAPQFADDHLSPRRWLVGHPLAPFLTVPQLATAAHGLGSSLEPAPSVGLQAPLVLPAPQPSPYLGWAADLSARTIDSYLLTCLYSTAPPELTSFWLHGAFLPDSPHWSHMLICGCSIARRWLLEKVHAVTDFLARVRISSVGNSLIALTRRPPLLEPTSCHTSSTRSHPPSYRTIDWLPGSPPRRSHLLLIGRSVIPARFTLA